MRISRRIFSHFLVSSLLAGGGLLHGQEAINQESSFDHSHSLETALASDENPDPILSLPAPLSYEEIVVHLQDKYNKTDSLLGYTLAYQEIDADRLYRLETKIDFNKIDVLRNSHKPKHAALLYDAIVIGRVIGRGGDRDEEACYHTKLHVSVERFLKKPKKLQEDEIVILQVPGPIGVEGQFICSEGEKKFEEGKEYVFFLSQSHIKFMHDNPNLALCKVEYSLDTFVASDWSFPSTETNLYNQFLKEGGEVLSIFQYP